MIVRMKKLTVLCLTSDRDEALGALRDLGVVHVTDRRPPAGDDLDALRGRLAATQRALSGLPKKAARGRRRETRAAGEPAETGDVVADVLALLDRRDALERRGDELRRELARYAGFGAFDLDEVRELERAGVWTALVVAPPGEHLSAPDGVVLTELRRDRTGQYAVLTGTGARPEPFPDLGGHHEIVPWPAHSLDDARDELAACEAGLVTTAERLDRLAPARDSRRRARAGGRGRRPLPGGPHRHGGGRRGRPALRVPAGAGAGHRARGCRRARLGPAVRRPRARRRRPRPAQAVPLGRPGAHGVRLPAHLPGLLGERRRLDLPAVLQHLLRDDRRGRRLRRAPAHRDGHPPAAPQEGPGARVPHDVHRRLRDPGVGRDERQLLRHPHAAAVPGGPGGPVGAGPRQRHRPVLLHRRGAPLVRARLERGDLRAREDLEQAPRAGRVAGGGVVDVLPGAADRAEPRRPELPALGAGRSASSSSPSS